MPAPSGPLGLPDRYRLDGLIATGGMAAVYAAHDRALDRPVAVKVLAEHLTSNPEARLRFEREARAAAALSTHPAVVTIYDVGEHDGRSFIVMERRMGGTVADALRRGAISQERALRWLGAIAEAIDAAHARGVVHRDIKPGNLLLDENDHVAVADFGIASLAHDGEQLTKTGEVLGTGAYLAPEQASGDAAKPAADRYALAVVAYELLTGSQPFAGGNFASQIRAHMEDPPPAAPGLPEAAQDVIKQGMAKRPEDRWASADRFVAALRTGLQGETATQAAPGPGETTTRLLPDQGREGGRRRGRAALGGAAAGGAAASGGTIPGGAAASSGTPRGDAAASGGTPRRGAEAGGVATPGSPPRGGDGPGTGDGLSPRRRTFIALCAVLVALLAGVAIAASGGDDPSDKTKTKTTADKPAPKRDKKPERTATPSPTPSPTPPPPTPTATPTTPPATPVKTSVATGGDPADLNAQGYELLTSGDAAGAVPLLQQAVEACGDSDALDPCGFAYYNYGVALTAAGSPAEAIPILQARLERWGYDRPNEIKKALKDACKAAGQKHC